jgi:hydrogenase maturation protease
MDAVRGVKKCLVIGYGNTLRGDDGLGPYVAEDLQGVVSAHELLDVSIMAIPQLDVVLACQMGEADLVIFVDARVDDSEELVKIRRIEPAADLESQLQTPHTISSMPALLRISLDWYRAAPLCYAVMPKGYDFSVGETISAKARIAATHARTKIIEILGQHIKTKEPECNLSQG